MHDVYETPFSSRYASKEMQYLFSPDNKFRTWRRLWIALAQTEQELGLPITDEQIAELQAHADDINYDVAAAREKGLNFHVGNVLSSDMFYAPEKQAKGGMTWADMGVLAVEMESAALYCNAAEAGKRALAVCTVSDNLLTGEALSTTERQTSFTQMITLALEVAVDMAARRA